MNKKLPEEIIYEIMTYLTIKDILHLCISKVFLPCFVNSSWVLKKINNYFIHLLGHAYYKSNQILLICLFHPVIINDTFHFSINHTKLPYFKNKKILNQNNFDLYQLNNVLEIWSILFQPYANFKKHKTFYLKTIQNFPSCNSFCPCHKYKMFPFYM